MSNTSLVFISFSLFLSFGATAPSGPWLPHSRGFYITHNDVPQPVGLLWMSDQPVTEKSTCQHTTLATNNIHALGGIQTHDFSERAAANLRFRTRGHWDRRLFLPFSNQNFFLPSILP